MDVNNFGPFDADVWGTFSDWIIAAATVGSIILLVKTLRSQTSVQILQLRVTRIENEKFRVENLPKFEIKISNVVYGDTTQERFELSVLFNIYLLKNSAVNAKIIATPSHGQITNSDAIQSRITLTEQSKQPFKIIIMVNKTTYTEIGLRILLNMTFCDMVGNKYSQDFTFDNTFTNNQIIQDAYPTLLNPL
jgi:hypothetical protein